MKIISFSLWGNDPKYSVGAVKNAILQKEIYPDWTCRFYIERNHPAIQELKKYPCEIIEKEPENCIGLFWRFEAAFDSSIEKFIVRDCDSRLNERESDAVKEWEESNFDVHSMKDNFYHRNYHMLAGMWGARVNFIPNFKELLERFITEVRSLKRETRVREEFDQRFLNTQIWPFIQDRCMIHDDLANFSTRITYFKKKLATGSFVGQQLYSDDRPLPIP
jgi:hypothetical protein